MQEQHQVKRSYAYNFSDEQMRHYFYKVPSFYIRLLLIGTAILILGIVLAVMAARIASQSSSGSYYDSSSGTYSGSSSASFLGNPLGQFSLFLMISGGVFLVWGGIPFLVYNDRPTDEAYAKWVIERRQPLYDIALQRLHIVDESECESIIEVQGGVSSLLQLTKKFPEKEIVVKRLTNGYRRYSINVCTYIFLTKDEVAIYSGYINALTQKERFEDADRYYYKDIVGVSTSGPVYTSWNISPEEEIQMQGFFVRMSNGDAVGTDYASRVILRQGENRIEIKGVDKVVAALLQLLREHKLSATEANTISRDIP